jgi:hypothetical protein
MSIHGLLVQTPDRRLVIDICVGNEKPRRYPAFDRLATDFLKEIWMRSAENARAFMVGAARTCTGRRRLKHDAEERRMETDDVPGCALLNGSI